MSRVVVNHEGFRRLLTSPQAQAAVTAVAEDVAARAGGPGKGFHVRSETGKNRARAAVVADRQGLRRELKNQTLTRSLHGG